MLIAAAIGIGTAPAVATADAAAAGARLARIEFDARDSQDVVFVDGGWLGSSAVGCFSIGWSHPT
jgi:hypothetical protein